MSEDYRDSLRTERHDVLRAEAENLFAQADSIETTDDDLLDTDDEFDYAEFRAWVSRQSWAPEGYREGTVL